jgi:hypothetical protein
LVSLQYDAHQSRKLKIQREVGEVSDNAKKNPLLQDACPLEKEQLIKC